MKHFSKKKIEIGNLYYGLKRLCTRECGLHRKQKTKQEGQLLRELFVVI